MSMDEIAQGLNNLFGNKGSTEPAADPPASPVKQQDSERALLDKLLEESRLYKTTEDYQQLLDFTVKLRNFAPFNAMLLHIQKPGLSYAASARDWLERFNRYPKRDARPLLILWPFGPVALVYDKLDTEGDPLPEDAQMFPAKGAMTAERLKGFSGMLVRKRIELAFFDGGDASAGSIGLQPMVSNDKDEKRRYLMRINQNHDPVTQFVTLAHELGHLCLGHLGKDKDLSAPDRRDRSYQQREIEAESVAYIVCHRQGIEPKSQTYLSDFVNPKSGNSDDMEGMDFYQVMRAAGQVETLLGLVNHVKFTRPKKASGG
jgi:hypothetical protein